MRKAFTLIELLVVIAIIAILAAILFPVFAQAKLAAKKTAELSNCKQIGTGTKLYLADSDDMYPSGNTRIAADGSSSQGEIHWSWVLAPYMKNNQVWVSPLDPNGGWAPTCWNPATNNQGAGVPGIQPNGCTFAGYPATAGGGIGTNQVPRLSFAANQLIFPRKRRAQDTTNIISETVIDNVSRTIMMTAMTDSLFCMRSSDGEFRTYRGALGMRDSASITNSFSSALPATSQLWALNRAELESVGICRTGVQGVEHIIRFANFGRVNANPGNSFNGGNNYIYVDGSAKYQNFLATFNTSSFQWGLAGYSLGGAPVIDRNTNMPVQ